MYFFEILGQKVKIFLNPGTTTGISNSKNPVPKSRFQKNVSVLQTIVTKVENIDKK
jgi:hypothetical protein